ncbi:RagB/SusD family nutrient uptake outer membrane protein [Panacibacter sp. DH6]|uniref:RagB/SusD family nutrient uptake outer membrane protein n=1 Tax=Panacibacter microcysteis TaxID=2793269 RepID=A0A931GW51_9BACT|nr:RagB/SusD family nutrient uptake outer membrane protein [Panacibacter microcysteis]MBG9377200.1 RagB/SusD family nutrient uptake outer membrane protein [Panacibacter microcysteis]
MNRNIKIWVTATGLGIAAIVACNKKLDVTDQNNPTTESYFKTAAELQNGVNAIYSTLRSGNLVGREWFFTHDMRGSETAPGGAQLEAPRAELLKQPAPSSSNAVMTSIWTGTYQMINRANLVISKAPDVTDNPASRDISVGEAEFLRAWAYFELVSMWGDVPLYTEPVASASDFKAKSPAADIYNLIISDLTDAAAKLPAVASQGGRATSGAANALLGRVQMQNGDYAAAKEALLKVYGKYSLVPFLHNFDGDVRLGATELTAGHEFNAESIFEVAFVDRGDNNFNWGYTGEGATANSTTMRSQEYGIVWGNVVPSDLVLNEFEPNDPRYKFTIFESGDKIKTMAGTEPGVALTEDGMNVAQSNRDGVLKKRVYRKYSILDWTDDGFHPDGINQRMIRYADVLLMLAECEAETGNPAGAARYINEVRARPGVNMPAITTGSKEQAIEAVMHERIVELAGEEVNNIDILRWRARGYYPSIRPDPKPGQVSLFPIPASETSTNPLIQ